MDRVVEIGKVKKEEERGKKKKISYIPKKINGKKGKGMNYDDVVWAKCTRPQVYSPEGRGRGRC